MRLEQRKAEDHSILDEIFIIHHLGPFPPPFKTTITLSFSSRSASPSHRELQEERLISHQAGRDSLRKVCIINGTIRRRFGQLSFMACNCFSSRHNLL